ncbi:MAG: MraY family glycosyltransferase, partial [Candidatus Wallbacteria bacterium]|nr:MraY family glycosyltransferase [Candidatus Wallbacteria bacterium]
MTDPLALFLISLISNILITPLLIIMSYKLELFDQPEFRKMHKRPVPRIGGLGIFATFFLITLFFFAGPFAKKFLFTCLLIFLTGFSDDLKAITYRSRLLLTVSVAVLFILLFNVNVSNVGIPLPLVIALPFTVFAITGFINAFNMIDGLNGLSSGTALISFFALGYAATVTGEQVIFSMLVVLSGATLAFFCVNFFSGSVFIGDGGTYFLGFTIVAISIFLGFHHPEISPWFFILASIYPVTEIMLTVFRRVPKKKKAFLPDKTHFHHLLYKVVKQHEKTTILILLY